MQTYICKCGKTFEKSSKADTTGYTLTDYSPQHECYGCPYIVTERDWQTNEIVKRECRATPTITYLTRCRIGTGGGDFSACYIYSLDLVFVKRVLNFVNSLDGVENHDHAIPDEWRTADFGKCYHCDDCSGLALFPLFFQKNKAGTEARRTVVERFFNRNGYYNAVRKDMTEEQEKEIIMQRIAIAKENALRNIQNDNSPMANLRKEKEISFQRSKIPAMRWDGNPAFEKDIHKALEHICILPVRHMIQRGDSSKDIAEYLTSEYKAVAGYCDSEWDGFYLLYDDNHLYLRYEGRILNNQKADTISLTWSKVAKELIDKYRASNAEASTPKEEKTMSAPLFNLGAFISETNQLKQLPLDMLVPYHNHKFTLYTGERLEDMVNSIKENGVLIPIIARAINGGDNYEILAGHNRCNAARLAGLTVVPGIVKENLSDEEAEMYVIETNLMQRGFDDLKPTERAAVVAARHSAMFDEEKRRAIERELALLNGDEVEDDEDNKKSKLATVGEAYGLSKDTIARLIRIDKLAPELKPYVDEGKIAIRAAVNLSYLFSSEQRTVAELIEFGVDMKKSALLREISRQNKLNDDAIREILVMGTYGKQEQKRKPIKVKISTNISDKYFAPDWDEAKVQDIINLALEQYFSKQLPESELELQGACRRAFTG